MASALWGQGLEKRDSPDSVGAPHAYALGPPWHRTRNPSVTSSTAVTSITAVWEIWRPTSATGKDKDMPKSGDEVIFDTGLPQPFSMQA